MGNKAILMLVGFLGLQSCQEFHKEKVVLNFKENYIEVLSDEYVIDSLTIANNVKKYYQIGLSNKNKGAEIIYYNRPNSAYTIFIDSLDYNCSKISETDLPILQLVLRKRGYIGKISASDNVEIHFANYNQIPCNSDLIDTIMTDNPYK